VVVAAGPGRRRRGTPTLCPMCTAHCTLWHCHWQFSRKQ
jgi:hypothetical protein